MANCWASRRKAPGRCCVALAAYVSGSTRRGRVPGTYNGGNAHPREKSSAKMRSGGGST